MTEDLRNALVTLREFLPPEENNRITDILDRRSCFLEDDEAAQLIFWIVWNWAKGQELWPKFVAQNGDYQMDEPAAGLRECGWIDTELIDPVKFPELIANYLEEQRHDSHRNQR